VSELPDFDLDGADPAMVYATITDLSEAEFEDLMSDPGRRSIVIEALIRHMAELFRADRAGAIEAVIHVKLWDRPGGGYDHAELVIANGECIASTTPEHEPRLTLKIRPTDLRKLVTGETGPRRLVLRRRMTVLGDLAFGTKLPELFRFG
jgi:putative sterol carrier protein